MSAPINIPRSRRPRPDQHALPPHHRRRAFALPPPRVCLLAAATRSREARERGAKTGEFMVEREAEHKDKISTDDEE
jgi:hypothetical protein